MTYLPTQQASATVYVRAGAAALLVLVLTTVHHIYGAVVYDTPWRLHVAQIAVPIGVIVFSGLVIAWVQRGARWGYIATWIAAAAILIFPVTIIGLYEGGYNHLVKNVLYFSGATDLAAQLFPAPMYEMPNDFFFEATGIAQLLAALVLARYVIGLLSERM